MIRRFNWVIVGLVAFFFMVYRDNIMSSVGSVLVRGMRNNNPFNVRNSSNFQWKGQIGVDDKGFCVFGSLSDGVRAGVKNLVNGYFSKGLNIRQIIERYAPSHENNTENYISHVVRFGYFPDEYYVPFTDDDRLAVCRAIVKMEVGFINDEITGLIKTNLL